MIVGIIGAGQLARMMALAGYPLGLRFVVLDPALDACGGQVAPLLQGAYDDPVCLTELAKQVDVVTFDFENVPAYAAEQLAQQVPVYPPPKALAVAQDRLSEKTLFTQLGIPTPAFRAVDTLDDLQEAVTEIGLPAVLKTCRMGYDGKGQRVLRQPEDVTLAFAEIGGVPLILEGFVPFQREVSLLAARGRDGHVVYYPLAENQHRAGILHLSHAPCPAPALAQQAQDYITRIINELQYVGVLAVEFFDLDGQLVVNEMAPRVHNSGHWTIEGAETSQFENHLRAVCGLPLGSTAARGCSAMLNHIGQLPSAERVLAVAGAHFHDYGKQPRAGRKVGHTTVRADSAEALAQSLHQLLTE